MTLNKVIKAVFVTLGIVGACTAHASISYTYTDASDPIFTGSFSVDSALADGSYHFLNAVNQPAGFTDNFFTTSFIDGRNVTRTPSLSLFDITIQNGLVSVWDIRATTLFTSVTYGTGGRGSSKVYHDNSVLIYHDTNVPYTPGGGLAYQATIASGDYQTYYTAGFAYQEALTGAYRGPGVWSIGITPVVSAVPLPPSIAMFAAGLLGFGALRRNNSTK